jgi:hypothetical protein
MDRSEEDAWAAVAARWQEEDAHRAYLAAHADLEGLAEAGRRYRAALERDPADAVALRWRDEVVRRATAIALAQLPRTKPAPERAGIRRGVVAALALMIVGGLAYAALRLAALSTGATP